MEINKAVDVLKADLTNMYGRLMAEENKRLELSYEALEVAITALKAVNCCEICKYSSNVWDEEPCDRCFSADSGFELDRSIIGE